MKDDELIEFWYLFIVTWKLHFSKHRH